VPKRTNTNENKYLHMKKTYLVYLFLHILFYSNAQSHKLKINTVGSANAHNTLQAKAFLISYYVTKKNMVDTVSLKNNAFEFILNDTLPEGLYQLMLYTNRQDASGQSYQPSFDVILNKQNVELNLNIDKTNSLEAITVVSSDANKHYHSFLQLNYLYQQKIKVIQGCMQQYPKADAENISKTDLFYTNLRQQEQVLARQHQAFYKSYLTQNALPPLANEYIKAQLPPSKQNVIPAPPILATQELKHSPFITQIVWNYLYHYKMDSLNNQRQQQQLIKGLEKLMPNLLADKDLANQLIEYLSQSFEKIGMTDLVLYLSERYLASQTCETPQQLYTLQEKINTLKLLQIGMQAPNIVMDSIQTNSDLYHIASPYTLLLFWESNCSHCQQLVPELKDFYLKQSTKQLEILAISLDTNKDEYLSYIIKNNLSWINYADLKGWESSIIKQYAISGTPTMILLDKGKKIIAKPLTLTELLIGITQK
jgi:thioredoxin-related protein